MFEQGKSTSTPTPMVPSPSVRFNKSASYEQRRDDAVSSRTAGASPYRADAARSPSPAVPDNASSAEFLFSPKRLRPVVQLKPPESPQRLASVDWPSEDDISPPKNMVHRKSLPPKKAVVVKPLPFDNLAIESVPSKQLPLDKQAIESSVTSKPLPFDKQAIESSVTSKPLPFDKKTIESSVTSKGSQEARSSTLDETLRFDPPVISSSRQDRPSSQNSTATAIDENVAPATNQQAKEWPEEKKMNNLIQQAEALLKERTSPMASASARRARRDTRQKTTNKTKSMAPSMDSTPSLPPTDTWSDKDLSREDPKGKEQEAPEMVRGRLYNLNTDRSKLPKPSDLMKSQDLSTDDSVLQKSSDKSPVPTTEEKETVPDEFLCNIAMRALNAKMKREENSIQPPHLQQESVKLNEVHQEEYFPPALSGDTLLKRSLEDASVVMQDERASSVGSRSTTSRSSLSEEELSNIAMRALDASRALDGASNRHRLTTLRTSNLRSKVVQQRIRHVTSPSADSLSKSDKVNADTAVSNKQNMLKKLRAPPQTSPSPLRTKKSHAEHGSSSEVANLTTVTAASPRRSRVAMFKAANQRVGSGGVVRHGMDYILTPSEAKNLPPVPKKTATAVQTLQSTQKLSARQFSHGNNCEINNESTTVSMDDCRSAGSSSSLSNSDKILSKNSSDDVLLSFDIADTLSASDSSVDAKSCKSRSTRKNLAGRSASPLSSIQPSKSREDATKHNTVPIFKPQPQSGNRNPSAGKQPDRSSKCTFEPIVAKTFRPSERIEKTIPSVDPPGVLRSRSASPSANKVPSVFHAASPNRSTNSTTTKIAPVPLAILSSRSASPSGTKIASIPPMVLSSRSASPSGPKNASVPHAVLPSRSTSPSATKNASVPPVVLPSRSASPSATQNASVGTSKYKRQIASYDITPSRASCRSPSATSAKSMEDSSKLQYSRSSGSTSSQRSSPPFPSTEISPKLHRSAATSIPLNRSNEDSNPVALRSRSSSPSVYGSWKQGNNLCKAENSPSRRNVVIDDVASIMAKFGAAPTTSNENLDLPSPSGTNVRSSRTETLKRLSSSSVARHRLNRGAHSLQVVSDLPTKETTLPALKMATPPSPRRGRLSQHPACRAKNPTSSIDTHFKLMLPAFRTKTPDKVKEINKAESEDSSARIPLKCDNKASIALGHQTESNKTKETAFEKSLPHTSSEKKKREDGDVFAENVSESDSENSDEHNRDNNDNGAFPTSSNPQFLPNPSKPNVCIILPNPSKTATKNKDYFSNALQTQKRISLSIVDEEDYLSSVTAPSSSNSGDGTGTLPSHLFHSESEKSISPSRVTTKNVGPAIVTANLLGDFESYSDDSHVSGKNDFNKSDTTSASSGLANSLLENKSTFEPSTLLGQDFENNCSNDDNTLSDQITDIQYTLIGEFHIKSSGSLEEQEERPKEVIRAPKSLLQGPDEQRQSPEKSLVSATTALQWWQNTYAWTQIEEINAAVQKALMSSSSKVVTAELQDPTTHDDTPKKSSRSLSRVRNTIDEDDDIFGGIDEEALEAPKLFRSDHGATLQDSKSSKCKPAAKSNKNLDDQTETGSRGSSFKSNNSFGEDVFSGVSASVDSSNILNKLEYGKQYFASRLQKAPPPPPPGSHFGTVLDGSAMLETVHSVITSSVLAGETSNTQNSISQLMHFDRTTIIDESATATEKIDPQNQVIQKRITHKQKSLLVPRSDDTNSTMHAKPMFDAHLLKKRSSRVINLENDKEPINDKKLCEKYSEGPFFRFGSTVVDNFVVGICAPIGNGHGIDDDNDDLRMSDAQSVASNTANVSIAESELSEEEKNVWNARDRRDHNSNMKPIEQPPAEPKPQNAGQAHNTLKSIIGAIHTLPQDIPKKPTTYDLPGLGSPTTSESSVSGSGTSAQVSSSDMSSKMMIFEDSTDDTCRSYDGRATPHSRATTGTSSAGLSAQVQLARPTTTDVLSQNQGRILENFTSSLKRKGIEVLKLSRDLRWQFRHLTVSSETRLIKFGQKAKSDHYSVPLGILWQKRFNLKGKESSVLCIDNQGHGGMVIEDLRSVAASTKADSQHPIPRKFANKFSDSVSVTITYSLGKSTRFLILRCQTTEEAHFVCTGLRVLIDFLRREKAYKLDALLTRNKNDGDYVADESADAQ